MKRVLAVLLFACVLAGFGAGAAAAAAPAPAPAGWDFLNLGSTFSMQPLLDSGRLLWFPFGTYPPKNAQLYDVASGTTKTLPDGVSPESADLRGDHLAYVTSDNMGISTLSVLTLSTGQNVTVQQGPYVGWPQIRGDLVLWSQSVLGIDGRLAPRIYAYSLSTDETRILVDSSIAGSDPWEFWASDRWVVFNGQYDPLADAAHYWALELSTGRARDLGTGLWPQALEGDDLFYLPSPYEPTELHRLNLSTGESVLVTGGIQIQSVCADGDHLAWAYWADYVAYVVLYDLTTGNSIRIPVPGYGIGALRLKGNLLIWLGVASGPGSQNSPGHDYVFAYDISRRTMTRLSRVYHYPSQWITDGSSVAFPQFQGFSSPMLMTVATPSVQPATEFVDVSGTDPYRTAVLGLRDAGVVVGYPSTEGRSDFRPGASLTRAQFAKMLVLALQVPISEGAVAPFSDLGPDDPSNLFPHDYIAALAELGILQGSAPGRFSPNAPVSRAQMVTLVVRALTKLHPMSLASPQHQWDGPALGIFDPVHGPTMSSAEFNALLDGLVGYGGLWDPWASASRAEAAQVLWNIPATQLVPDAKSRLAAALGVSTASIGVYPPSGLDFADSLLKWPGGEAWLDTAGRVTLIIQDERPADPPEVYLSAAELEAAADRVLSRLGWDTAALAGEGFQADPSRFTDQSGTHEFVQTWTGYTSQGIQNSGSIEIRLDARDGKLATFHYYQGAGNYPVDLPSVITRDQAIAIAQARVMQQYPNATVVLESATLKLTDASGVTGGETRLIWAVVFTGQDPSGIAAGGWVYLDAYSGALLQYLVPG